MNVNDILKTLNSNAQKAFSYITNNPEKVAAAIGATIALCNATKHLQVTHRVNSQNRIKDKTYYDPSTGFRWSLKRKMTNNDRLVITSRKKNGEDVAYILQDLRLI